MRRHVVWLVVVAAALAVGDTENSGVVLLQESGVKWEYNDKIPGVKFGTEADREQVASERGCRNICDDRGKECLSFSYEQVTRECRVSHNRMGFDPAATLGIKKQEGDFFNIPGLTYFHVDSGEWLPTSETSPERCAAICAKTAICKAYKFNKERRLCAMTGKTIEFGSNWDYFSKKRQSSQAAAAQPNPAPTVQEDPTKAAQAEVVELGQEIKQEADVLVKSKAEVVQAEHDAKIQVQNAQDDTSLQIMQDRLKQAKSEAEDMVVENMKGNVLDSKATKLQAQTVAEQAKLERNQELHKFNLDADNNKIKEEEAKKLAAVQQHIKNIEHAQMVQGLARDLKMNEIVVRENSTATVRAAHKLSQEVAYQKSQLIKQQKIWSSEIRSKQGEASKMMGEDLEASRQREREVERDNQAAIRRAVEMQRINLQNGMSEELANITSMHQMSVSQQMQKKRSLKVQVELGEKQLHAEQAQNELENKKIEGERDALKKAHDKTKEVYDGLAEIAEAGAKDSPQAEPNNKFAKMIANTMQAAAKAEAEAKAKADKATQKSAEAAAKAEAKTDEQNSKVKENAVKSKAAQAQAELDRVDALKQAYNVALHDARVTAKSGIEKVKIVAEQAAKVKDEEKANKILENAKKEWREKTRAAINQAEKLKAALPREERSFQVMAETSTQLQHNKGVV